eukprot:SAG31_NODE_1068_length_10079_cov_5.365331_3_plen_50_part_00
MGQQEAATPAEEQESETQNGSTRRKYLQVFDQLLDTSIINEADSVIGAE